MKFSKKKECKVKENGVVFPLSFVCLQIINFYCFSPPLRLERTRAMEGAPWEHKIALFSIFPFACGDGCLSQFIGK